ncbi:hypothetical protein I317_03686 [Kwoniella heveanensis CBS 569]|uniref:Phosphoglycerate mutase n=1 Tax=Kwoniella heveanensis BCC8398 TaxID=1296120 RepID=A0A1B9GQG8_9TREE|nr:hypothetical protein I316_04992 [Kwoniella heveanensis BCC8398]OCF42441.1 hypothetical protein I317_03686 [Kwoniella heveanensis CBS 569]
MTKYSYKHLDQFFVISKWEEDVKGPFGLAPPPGDWEGFKAKIKELNDQCPKGESVKVIFAARHGQGEYDTLREDVIILSSRSPSLCCLRIEADRYLQLPLQGQILYPILDPDLTPLGRSQAYQTRKAIQREVKRGMPVPEKWYTSPLRRAGETCGIEWGWLFDRAWKGGQGHGVPATVVENIREHLHVNQCDARLPLSALKPLFPSFTYPETMSDADDIWKPIEVRGRETEDELVARRGEGIAEVLERSGSSTYISVTAHSGALRGIYKSLNVAHHYIVVGEMNVLVIRVKEE